MEIKRIRDQETSMKLKKKKGQTNVRRNKRIDKRNKIKTEGKTGKYFRNEKDKYQGTERGK
jgi:hypothetical protein